MLLHEYFLLFNFPSTDMLDRGIYDFIYIKYNQLRPHSYLLGRTPYQFRYTA